ncbi:MAG: carboxypeptidase-like regulatory domain-containing protein [Nonlabens sp.]
MVLFNYKLKQQITFLSAVFLLTSYTCAQKINLRGKVLDTLQQPVENATVYSKPIGFEENLQFSISDYEGKYKLQLQKGKNYLITINYLGFKEIQDTVKLLDNTSRNYTLIQSLESLDEIILRKKLAVSVKKDTITYRTDQFTNGQERKLRDVLKKLPGLDVDREGNVTVYGKEVTKFMVDGKDFFNGDEKLGVNNIPADAVEEVVALDNYTEIPWLKGLTDSDKLALNIKLKDGKKNFVFGDIAAGGGFTERYKFNPNLFYYSPKTSVNFIGNLSNTGDRSFTVEDYLNFELGEATLSNYSDAISRALSDPLSTSLSTTDFRDLENIFGAFNLNHEFESGLNLSLYSINNDDDQSDLSDQRIDYLIQDDVVEDRTTTQNKNQFFTANTFKLQKTTSRDLDVLARIDFKDYNSRYEQILKSQTRLANQFNDRLETTSNFSLNAGLNLNKRFNSKHISTLEMAHRYEDRDSNAESFFNNSLFPSQVPLIDQDSGVFNVLQNTDRRTQRLNFDFKHYYVINATTHLYPLTGMSSTRTNFNNNDLQIEDNQNPNSFFESGFNNELETSIQDFYIGAQFKKKFGKTIVKPGLVSRFYNWKAANFNQQIINTNRLVLLPELLVEFEPRNTRMFSFNYSLQSQFAEPLSFANRLRIASFNQVVLGNKEVRNSLYHNTSLRYSSFKLLEGTTFFVSINYQRFIEGVRSATQIDGIEQTITTIVTDLPEDNFSTRLEYSTYIEKLKVFYQGFGSLSTYSRIINREILDYQSLLFNNKVGVESRFKGSFNFEVAGSYSFSNLAGTNLENKFENWVVDGLTELNFLKHFTWKTDAEFTYFKNLTTSDNNNFLIVNSSLDYWKESSPWTFKVQMTNAFDNDVNFSNSINQFQAIENRVFVQPRILLFSVGYKL